jgi:hypothetical protein
MIDLARRIGRTEFPSNDVELLNVVSSHLDLLLKFATAEEMDLVEVDGDASVRRI